MRSVQFASRAAIATKGGPRPGFGSVGFDPRQVSLSIARRGFRICPKLRLATVFFHAVQGGEERTGFDLEGCPGIVRFGGDAKTNESGSAPGFQDIRSRVPC